MFHREQLQRKIKEARKTLRRVGQEISILEQKLRTDPTNNINQYKLSEAKRLERNYQEKFERYTNSLEQLGCV